jgi:hypothetical protein
VISQGKAHRTDDTPSGRRDSRLCENAGQGQTRPSTGTVSSLQGVVTTLTENLPAPPRPSVVPTANKVNMLEWEDIANSAGSTFQATLTDPHGLPVGNTAECIVETPPGAPVKSGLYPLASFGHATFGPCEATDGSTLVHNVLDVINGQRYLVDSSFNLHAYGSPFKVDRLNIFSHGRVLAEAGVPVIEAGQGLDSFTDWWKGA